MAPSYVARSYLVDTNILLRMVQSDSSEHPMIRECLTLLWEGGADLFFTSQNLAEFWNVCTRPAEKNGFGFSIERTHEHARLISSNLTLAPDSEQTHQEWLRIVFEARVSGVQVHDARLAAAMRVHGISQLLTLNVGDFRRYGIVAIHPASFREAT